jgi:5,10-methylenetetrahydrofolate reductase
VTAASGLTARLAAREFLVTSELVPPRDGDAAAVERSVEQLAFADALNITDLPRARPRVSALAAAAIAIRAGAEPILQMTTRDRNRIALASDALGAIALGVGAVLPLGGDPIPEGVPGKAVGDLDAGGLAAAPARRGGGVAEVHAGRLARGQDRRRGGIRADPGRPRRRRVRRLGRGPAGHLGARRRAPPAERGRACVGAIG